MTKEFSRPSGARQLPQMLAQARALAGSGYLGQAHALLQGILQASPDHAETLHLSGVIAAMRGEADLAAQLLGRAIRVDSSNAAIHTDLGVVLKGMRQWQAALRCYDRAIDLNPGIAEAHNNRGNVLRELNQPQAALDSYHRAISLKPDYAEAHHNLGATLSDLHQWQDGLTSISHAIALCPDYANAYCNRGLALERLGRLEAALADYDRAIGIDARFIQAYANRGNVLRELGRAKAAVASCDKALALASDHAQAHQNRSVALLLLGDYVHGWAEFEWRWKNPHSPLSLDSRPFSQPLWLGEYALEGKRILLRAEQGIGDTLQFCRYARMVAARGAQVVLEVQPLLVGVMASLGAEIEVIARGDLPGDFDYQCPLMSLPLAFGTTLETVPAAVPYLHADPLKAQRWRERLGRQTAPRVGLVWSGGLRHNLPEFWALHGRRNIALSQLAPLRDAPVEFYSLHKGQPAESELTQLLAQRWEGPQIRDLTADLHDFSDTAALIEQLDLVISVDTSTAHLAAAMGKRVWLLNRFDTCWRWLLEREDSPWYPTLQVYRQPQLGDWNTVVQRVREDLVQWAQESVPLEGTCSG